MITTRVIGMSVLLASLTIGGAAIAQSPGKSGGGGNNGNGTVPGHSNGKGGGNGGNSGGAPSPEVSAILGLALAGGTITFLRRKRRNQTTSAA